MGCGREVGLVSRGLFVISRDSPSFPHQTLTFPSDLSSFIPHPVPPPSLLSTPSSSLSLPRFIIPSLPVFSLLPPIISFISSHPSPLLPPFTSPFLNPKPSPSLHPFFSFNLLPFTNSSLSLPCPPPLPSPALHFLHLYGFSG